MSIKLNKQLTSPIICYLYRENNIIKKPYFYKVNKYLLTDTINKYIILLVQGTSWICYGKV